MKWLLVLVLWLPLAARTLTLVNDSPYHLTAKVYDGQGTLVATIPVDRGATGYWDYLQGSFTPQFNTPYALYTVRWFCRGADRPYDYSDPKKGEEAPEFENEFANWPSVAPGATVTAQASPNGSHQCVKRKKKPEEQAPGKPSKKPDDDDKPTPDAQQNERFLNDGGIDWSNNGAPGASANELFPPSGDPTVFQSNPNRWKNN